MFHHDRHPQDTSHGHPHHAPQHTHGVVDPALLTTQRGMWAIQWSFLGLLATALPQIVVVWLSGSVALLADTIHNVTDAGTAIPLWVAFTLIRRPPSKRFSYGYGRVEDLAGVAIVLSAIGAGYVSIHRLVHPQPVDHLWAVMTAAIIGFLGNEAVAVFRIKVGHEIDSAALVADGYHARVDGLASLAVLGGALGVWAGYPLLDPLIGILITAVILRIVWQSGRLILTRLLDGLDPEIIDAITRGPAHARRAAGDRGAGTLDRASTACGSQRYRAYSALGAGWAYYSDRGVSHAYASGAVSLPGDHPCRSRQCVW